MGPWVMLAAAVASPAPEAVAPNASPPNAATPDSAARGVIPYPPSFFAESRPVNAYDMVVRLPGFTFDKGATVRGLSGAGGNVLIDGQPPVSKNDALDEILKRIPAGAVERVELIRGGAPGIDMEGRTVLANIVRKQTAGFRAAVMPGIYQIYDGRQLPGVRVEAQWRWPGGRSAEFGQVYGTGPNDEFGDGRRTRYNPDGSVRLRSKVDADAYGLRAWTTGACRPPVGGRARINGAFMLTPAEVEIYDRYETAAGANTRRTNRPAPGRTRRPVQPRPDRTPVAGGGGLPPVEQPEDHGRLRGARPDARLPAGPQDDRGRRAAEFPLPRESGPDLRGGRRGRAQQPRQRDAARGQRPPAPVPAANVQVEEKRADAFLRGSWRPMPTLTLEAGVRQEVSRVTSAGDVTLGKTLTFTKPRAAVTWAADPSSQVRLRVEREVGQLNFDDFVASPNVASTGVVVAGNPDLTPQQAWVFEAAYERRFWGAGAAVLTVRHFEIQDTIDRGPARDASGTIIRDPVTGQPAADRPDNIGESTKDEVQASLTVPLDRFGVRAAQLRGQVTKRWTKVDDPLLGGTREVSALRPIDWEAHFSQDLPRWNATWGVDVFGGFRERYFRLAEIETRKFSPWVVVYGEYKPQPDWILRLEAMGVTSRNVRRIREVYSGPRNAFPLDYTDVRSLEWDGSLYLRVRKTFGS